MQKKIRLLVNIVCAAVLIVMTVLFVVRYNDLPKEVPTHFNAAGEIDDYGSVNMILVMVVLNWIIWSFTSFIEVLPDIAGAKKAFDTDEPKLVSAVLLMVAFIKLGCVAGFSYIQFCMMHVQPLGEWFMPAFLMVMFIPMIIAGLYSLFVKK